MKEYFREDGCLTDAAFSLLAEQEEQSDLTRLEIAEHLSFCDSCILRYTDYLSKAPLLELEQEISPSVMERIRRRAQLIFFNRYVAAGMAACFALILWGTGFFTSLPGKVDQGFSALGQANEQISSYSGEKLSEFSQRLNEAASKWNEAFYKKEDKKGE